MVALIRERTYSSDYSAALGFASESHARQVTIDGTPHGTPYIAHLLRVSALVWEMGGTEEAAIAALLYQTVTTVGTGIQHIQKQFGPGVASIVWACTDKDFRVGAFESVIQSEDALEIEVVKLAVALDTLRSCLRLVGQPDMAEFIAEQVAKYKSLNLSYYAHDEFFVYVSELCKIIKQLDTNE
jgi:(p)ppGpp synthase/HD superfamily hydrolase